MHWRILSLFFLFLIFSCEDGQKKPSFRKRTPGSTPLEYTVEQLDSIGKEYKPEIGTYGGTVTFPLGANPDGFLPALSMSGYSSRVTAYIYEGLISIDPVTLEEIPHIAKSWNVSDDGLVWTFKMRDDVYFSDSVKLSAHDVAFTYNDIIFNDALQSPRNFTLRIDGKKFKTEALDSFTVQFTLPKPFAPFLTSASVSIMPKHKYGREVRNESIKTYTSAGCDVSNIVGSGPFVLSKIELGQQVVLKRNPYYWQKDAKGNRLPYIDQLRLKIIEEPNQQVLKFQEGELDQITVLGSDYPILKPKEKKGNFRIYKAGPRWYNRFIKFNQNNQRDENGNYYVAPHKQKLFRDKRFRQAVAYSINYNKIINTVYNGLATPSTGMIGKHHNKFHNPNARLYSYNPAKADSLFLELGLKDRNGDGIREDKDGNDVSFSFSATANSKLLEDISAILKDDLKARGIEMLLDLTEFNTLINKTRETYKWDAVCYSLSVTSDPHFGKSSYMANSKDYVVNPVRYDKNKVAYPKTYTDWEERIIEIFEKGALEMDEAKRIALYQEWLAIEQEQNSTILLPVREVILGVQNRFGNIHLTKAIGRGESILHNIEWIYIKN